MRMYVLPFGMYMLGSREYTGSQLNHDDHRHIGAPVMLSTDLRSVMVLSTALPIVLQTYWFSLSSASLYDLVFRLCAMISLIILLFLKTPLGAAI